MSQIAVMSIAAEIDEEGAAQQISFSTNLNDLTFWRVVLDQIWVRDIKEQAKGATEPSEERSDG